MSINIGRYAFEGPYSSTDLLEDRSGVYAIIDRRDTGNYPIDVGESSAVRSRVENHDRKGCWNKHAQGQLLVAVYYTPHLQQAGRKEIEQEIRDEFNPPCGER